MNCPTQLHLVGHSYKICIMMHGSMNVMQYSSLRREVISCWNSVVTFASEPTFAVGRTKRCSGIWFETVVPSSCFAVHVWGLVLEWLR